MFVFFLERLFRVVCSSVFIERCLGDMSRQSLELVFRFLVGFCLFFGLFVFLCLLLCQGIFVLFYLFGDFVSVGGYLVCVFFVSSFFVFCEYHVSCLCSAHMNTTSI